MVEEVQFVDHEDGERCDRVDDLQCVVGYC